MKKIKYLLLTVVLVATMIMGATTAFAYDVGSNTATLSVSGLPSEVHNGDIVDVTITLTGDNGAKIGGNTGNITLSGLEFQKVTGGTGTMSATGFASAFADSNMQNVITWSAAYKVTAETGDTVSISVTSTANEGSETDYAYITVKGASVSSKVVAAETKPSVSKDALTAAITDAKAKLADESKYTDETVAALKTALAAAENIAAKADASQTEVDEAADALTAAMNGLKAKPTAEPSEPKDDVPKTGDESLPMWPFVVLMVVSGTAAVVILRKKASFR